MKVCQRKQQGLRQHFIYCQEFKNTTVKPKSLAGKLVLGKSHLKSETPYHKPLKVGNLKIFRGKLPILEMQEITNGSWCGEDGDYLA